MSQKIVVHLKHTGTELIADMVEINEENMAITIKNPATLQVIGQAQGEAQMGLAPFLMTCKDDTVHLPMSDILFVGDCRDDIAAEHSRMFSPVIQPPEKKIII